MNKMTVTRNAALVRSALNGVVCIYKPAGIIVENLRKAFLSKICVELNGLDVRNGGKMVSIEGSSLSPMRVCVEEDLSQHELVVGPRYQVQDFRVSFGTHLGRHTSGVLLLGLNEGSYLLNKWRESKMVRTYLVYGQFGLATDTYHSGGRVVEKAQYKHLTRGKIDAVVAHIQAAHQRNMYQLCGLDMATQAGYELACKGLVRPADSKIPIIYGIKCLSYQRPNFLIEVQTINEYEKYLHCLIHDIGMQLRTVAHCTRALRVREGGFTLQQALLPKHWTLQHVLDNMGESVTNATYRTRHNTRDNIHYNHKSSILH